MLSFARALAQVNPDLVRLLEASQIDADCSDLGHVFRRRKLTPQATTVHFIRQVLADNTACEHVRLLGDAAFSAPAYCLARQRLPIAVLERLHQRIATLGGDEGGTWCGRRTLLVDGTCNSMPDTQELRKHFRYPGGQKPGLGFPCASQVHLFNHSNGMLLGTHIGPWRSHDLDGIPALAPFIQKDDVLVGDRAFGCFVTLGLCRQRQADAVCRLNQGVLVDFTLERPHNQAGAAQVTGRPKSRWVKRLGDHDQIVVYHKPRAKSAILAREDWDALPEELTVREIRFQVNRPGWRPQEITLVTTLLDAEQFPKEKIAELYLARWQVEVNIRDLKQTLKMDILKGKSVDLVKKEIIVHGIVYNLVQHVRLASARERGGVPPGRVSFVAALRWLAGIREADLLPRLTVNPLRPGRAEPRAVKRRPKHPVLLMKPRANFKAGMRLRAARKLHQNKKLNA